MKDSMRNANPTGNRRVLLVDDNPAIHADFRKILVSDGGNDAALSEVEAELFGSSETPETRKPFELTSAYQGQEALQKLTVAMEKDEPFALAFVDIRMPPGWDGVETISRLWEVDSDLQIVICTAYADYSWDEMIDRLGMSDQLVILKKPFDAIEVQQLANALTEKWNLTRQARSKVKDLEEAVSQRTHELQQSNAHLRKEVKEREMAEQELRATQEKLNHFLSRNPAVLFSLRFESNIARPAWVTDNFAQFTGGSVEDWYQQTPSLEYVEEADCSIVIAGMEKLLSEDQVSLQYRVRVKDGSSRWVRDDRRLVRDSSGRPAEVIGCWTDITEQRKLQDQLQQSQKMESVGQLAGGVAHDFNNLLMVILGHIEMLINYEQLPNSTIEQLQKIQAAAERAGNLTRQLLAFSRKQIMRPRAMDLNDAIGSITRLLARTLGEHVTVTTEFDKKLPHIVADRSMIEQVIMNLAVNARDAMTNGGQISISTSVQQIPASHQEVQPDSRPGQFVCFCVTDTGCGIPEHVLPRIFEPFFTTKEIGKGTGLGLSTVYGNVKQHNGWVEVQSTQGHGTTFKIFLPFTDQYGESLDSTAVCRPVRGGKETILVVEDESALGTLMKTTLRRQGYQVHTASTGAEALAVWAARLDEIDLLLTDIVMPDGLSGWELAKELQSIKPALKVIYMSGYNTEMTNGRLTLDNNIIFLEKPFGPQHLAQKVRDCLDNLHSEDATTIAFAK
jgi:two-component system cell cycle sensor histidine kinase/response regulator CckA